LIDLLDCFVCLFVLSLVGLFVRLLVSPLIVRFWLIALIWLVDYFVCFDRWFVCVMFGSFIGWFVRSLVD